MCSSVSLYPLNTARQVCRLPQVPGYRLVASSVAPEVGLHSQECVRGRTSQGELGGGIWEVGVVSARTS